MLLEVVALTGDVGVDLLTVGEADTGYLTHSRVRLLRGGGVDTHAHASALGARVECRRLAVCLELCTALADELLNCRHCSF